MCHLKHDTVLLNCTLLLHQGKNNPKHGPVGQQHTLQDSADIMRLQLAQMIM